MSAGTASAPSPSGASVPAQSASASTAQQIQATGPAAVAAVRALQATAVGTSVAASKEAATTSGEGTPLQTGGGEVQALEDEPAAGQGEASNYSVPGKVPIRQTKKFALQQIASAASKSHAVGYNDRYKVPRREQTISATVLVLLLQDACQRLTAFR